MGTPSFEHRCYSFPSSQSTNLCFGWSESSKMSKRLLCIEQPQHQPDIWGLTQGMLQSLYILLLKNIPFLVKQNIGLVQTISD
jgi:hypothetical protein